MPRSTQTRNELIRIGGLLMRLAKAGDPAALEVLSHDTGGHPRGGTRGGTLALRGGTPDSVTPDVSAPRGGTPGGHPSRRRGTLRESSSVGTTNEQSTDESVRSPLSVDVSTTRLSKGGAEKGQGLIFADTRPLKRVSWPAAAGRLWEERYGAGSGHGITKRAGKGWRGAVEAVGEEVILYGWGQYLEAMQTEDSRYVSPESYIRNWRDWAEGLADLDEVDRAVELSRRIGEQKKRSESERWADDARLLDGGK